MGNETPQNEQTFSAFIPCSWPKLSVEFEGRVNEEENKEIVGESLEPDQFARTETAHQYEIVLKTDVIPFNSLFP